MFTIYLNNLIFHSFHGVHEEERILGAEFTVNAELSFKESNVITALDQTIDYVKVYALIKQQMSVPTALLETVAQGLADNIYAIDNRIASININIKKTNPPIENFQGSVGVSFKKDF
jgi:7,8-dihydroneopterin aldolase/epimerase/oxygenase